MHVTDGAPAMVARARAKARFWVLIGLVTPSVSRSRSLMPGSWRAAACLRPRPSNFCVAQLCHGSRLRRARRRGRPTAGRVCSFRRPLLCLAGPRLPRCFFRGRLLPGGVLVSLAYVCGCACRGGTVLCECNRVLRVFAAACFLLFVLRRTTGTGVSSRRRAPLSRGSRGAPLALLRPEALDRVCAAFARATPLHCILEIHAYGRGGPVSEPVRRRWARAYAGLRRTEAAAPGARASSSPSRGPRTAPLPRSGGSAHVCSKRSSAAWSGPLERERGQASTSSTSARETAGSYARLSERGHRRVAGTPRRRCGRPRAGAPFARRVPRTFGRVAASSTRFRCAAALRPRRLDASLYLAEELRVLAEAARAAAPGGGVAVLDSPFYARAESGDAMRAEKRGETAARSADVAEDLLVIPPVEFLTRERSRRRRARGPRLPAPPRPLPPARTRRAASSRA